MPKKKTPINPKSAERLKLEMDKANETRRTLESKTNISVSLIGQILNKKKPLIRENAEIFGKCFKVRTEYLMAEDDFRTEADYLQHIQSGIKNGVFIPTISEKTAYDILCSYLGIKELEMTTDSSKGVSRIYKISANSQEYYVDSKQKNAVRNMIEGIMKEQILNIYALLQPGNYLIKRQFQKALAELDLDDRPVEENLAEAERIRNDPNTLRIEPGKKEDSDGNN